LSSIKLLESGQTLVKRKHPVWAGRRHKNDILQRQLRLPGAALGSQLPAGIVNENSAHQLRGDGKKMGPVFPIGISLRNEFYIGFIHQRCCLQGVISTFVAEVAYSEMMKLSINDRNQFTGGLLIAVCKLP
jgi:hypothetical protein